MKIPYFCCIGAELKRYEKDFDFMNQVYLYKIPVDDTTEDVFAQDYFKAISNTVLQDDIVYIYESAEQMLHICRFDKANGHITAVPLISSVPELEPDRILVSDQDGRIAAGDLSLEYIKDTLSILHCTAILSGTVDTTTVVMLNELEAFANLDSRPSYKAAGALVIDANGNHGIIESVDTANETAVIVTTFAYNAVVKDSAETQIMQGGLQTPELETDVLIVNDAATFEEAPITNDTTTYQSAANDSLVRKEQIEEVVQDIKTSSLTFIGYVSTTEPSSATYTFNKHDLWLNSATMPTSFPFAQANIKEWNGTAWVAYNQDYTPANFDFFRNINDSEGYYWFAGQWVVMSTDMSTTYFQLNTVSGKWEIKSSVNLPGEPTVPNLTVSSPNNQIVNKHSLEEALVNHGTGRNVGDIFFTMRSDNELNGAVECNGATYDITDFTGASSIGELLEAGKLDYISLTAYATAISTKGWCDKIGWNGTGTTSFRVPTLTPHIVQKNNIPVVGNGKSVCYTNGSGTDIAILSRQGTASPATDAQTGGYTGTLGNITETAWYNGELGITTDGTKSGMIADLSDVATTERVMIQLFNGATDEAVATCTGVLADVAGLKDMSNVTPTGKETVVGWGIPDYSAGISVPFTTTWNTTGQTYTAPASGEFRLSNLAGNNPDTLQLLVNNIELCRSGKGSTVSDWRTFSCSVSKGDIIKVCTESGSYTATGVICKFFPYKGVI